MAKKYTTGLFLGKFMPTHNGHLQVIEQAKTQCDKLYVMVCSRICEPIDGERRFKWMETRYKRDTHVIVIHCDREVPQYPEDHPDFWQIWHDIVHDFIPEGVESVFGSETYITKFAEVLNANPEIVDLDRSVVSVSATDIRQNPVANWDYIPMEVKSFFQKRVAIVGTESTGKTTLTKELADYFNGSGVTEYGRDYCERTPPHKLRPSDFLTIGTEQAMNVNSARFREGRPLIFSDTEYITSLTYMEIYNKKYGYNSKAVDEARYFLEYRIKTQLPMTLYIVAYPDLEFEQDGTRVLSNTERLEHTRLILQQLRDRNLPFKILSGSGERRTLNAVSMIYNLIETSTESDADKMMYERTWARN